MLRGQGQYLLAAGQPVRGRCKREQASDWRDMHLSYVMAPYKIPGYRYPLRHINDAGTRSTRAPNSRFGGAAVDGPTSSDATGSPARYKVVSGGIPIPIKALLPEHEQLWGGSRPVFSLAHTSHEMSLMVDYRRWLATSLGLALLKSFYTNLSPQLITTHCIPALHSYITRRMTNRSASRLPCATSFGLHRVEVRREWHKQHPVDEIADRIDSTQNNHIIGLYVGRKYFMEIAHQSVGCL